jgi:hypothetical protein
MTAVINGSRYRIEFSYRRREGKRASLARNSPIAGVTACAIVSDWATTFLPPPALISVAASVCSTSDNWSRRVGRFSAFERAVMDCGMLREQKDAFLAWFAERFPQPKKVDRRLKFAPSPEEIERRKQQGRARKAGGA